MIDTLLAFLSSSWGQLFLVIAAPYVVRFVKVKLGGGQRSDASAAAESKVPPFELSSRARLAVALLAVAAIWQTAQLVLLGPPNLFHDLGVPRDAPNFVLRNAVRKFVGDRLGMQGARDLATMENRVAEDAQAKRMLDLWKQIKTEERRGMYCTFGEETFVSCGDACTDSSDFAMYTAPTIAWEYLMTAVVIGIITSNGLISQTSVRNEAADVPTNALAVLAVVEQEQQRRRDNARKYAAWSLLGGVGTEVLLLLLADGQRNDPFGVLAMPFLYNELWNLRRWFFLVLYAGIWMYARPQTLSSAAIRRTTDLTDPAALATLAVNELETVHQRMRVLALVRSAVVSDEALCTRHLKYHRAAALDRQAVEADADYMAGVERVRDRLQLNRLMEDAARHAEIVVNAGASIDGSALSDEIASSQTSTLHTSARLHAE
ncbi:hypothetical protein THASP1DRAFT_32986 [Thamnocephalis sphaerospora]|uniref:Uncharacterized protein n=1 Tax=Thamnocephalis sphaerospora TaxID=78915 RepID=A0A4P9XHJ8_9FUNG|nr:hypothetical protein THASP1DRAFT_32986 [Thamnocephalis sphaerospora]|eukprot:RKP05175.1 hypothetical protein THASP1DRAFT_32986 [Thamnocephalis sphaerospora]